ncbi:ATP-grasp domain-containing protein [Kitasatospora sp. NPDC006697]|uniref:ATP-grasp domain-containing protein n=1 Tax=Kitasatospora sp. NPDC006697 TaxID=3364020 RepID=UPI0036CC9D08
MKLLAIESAQNKEYYKSRYQQVIELGVDLYVLNGEGDPEFWPADRYRLAGSREAAKLVELAREWHRTERFEGVITFNEAGVVAAAVVAEALGLPGLGLEAAVASRNKYLMRQAHQRGAAAHPGFRLAATEAEALAAAEEFGYPVIVKPTLGAASNFVFKADTPEELAERYRQAADGLAGMYWSHAEAAGVDLGPDGLLIESFLDGRELLIEALAWDEEVYLGSVIDRITVEGATFDDDVHHGPTTLTADELAAVHRVVKAGMQAQGLRRSVAHAEVRFHRGEPYLLEIAARVGGGGLDECARLTAGYDPIRAVVDVARGVKPEVRHYRPTGTHITAMCLISEESGTIREIEVPERVSSSDRVFLLKLTAKPGDTNLRPPHGNSIIGFLGTMGSSWPEAMDTMMEFADLIKVAVDPR